MDVQFALQDPTDPTTTYLHEAIVAAAEGAESWRGLFAFASRNGVENLLTDPLVHGFFKAKGKADFVVGIDAVTNRQALERLQHFSVVHSTFNPRVFWNPNRGLFHPKLSHFSYADGRQVLIVGSGNLTPGGLRKNFEGYTVVSAEPGQAIDLSELDGFFARHASLIRQIDTAALEAAAKNVISITKDKTAKKPPPLVVPVPAAPIAAPTPSVASDRVLIAQVPGAGGRWSQLHLNQVVIQNFFRVTHSKTQRIFLSPVDAAGVRGEEEVRPIVHSETNKNYKIEVSQAKGLAYPTGTPPIIIFVERQLRTFDYSLIMPTDAAYPALLNLTKTRPAIGKGLPRIITTIADLQKAWPACPLLSVKDTGAPAGI